MSFVDVSQLGTRTVKRKKTVRVVDPSSGLAHLEEKVVGEPEVQPVLTAEEAATLEGADWKECVKPAMKARGKYYCLVSGRRFFSDVNPNDASDGVPDDAEPSLDMTKAQLIEIAANEIADWLPGMTPERTTAYFKEHDLGFLVLAKNNKAKLIEVITHFKEKHAA